MQNSEKQKRHDIIFKRDSRVIDLLKTRSVVRFLKHIQAPAGKSGTIMCRSKKKATQVVGWCSETDAMIGM